MSILCPITIGKFDNVDVSGGGVDDDVVVVVVVVVSSKVQLYACS
jgi:hypothetical protein